MIANYVELAYTAYISLSLAFSTLVFLLTLLRTLQAARQAQAAGVKNSLYYYLLRDGEYIQYSYSISRINLTS